MRISILLFSACALFSYTSAAPIQNPTNLSKDELWRELKKGVIQILHRDAPLTIAQSTSLSLMVYTYCTKATDKLTAAKQGTKLIGEDLYMQLSDLLEDYMVELFEKTADLNDEDLLKFYSKSWSDYEFSRRVINNVFNYLNRHWVAREKTEGRDVYTISIMGLVKWRDHMLKRGLNGRLTKTVLRMIEHERKGDLIGSDAIRNYIDCYVLLGMGETDFYRENFEIAFIDETKKFYDDESFTFFNENPIIDYIRHAERRFDEEVSRVNRYLHPSTTANLMKTCEDAFIKHRMDVLLSEFQGLLEKKEERSRDLRSLHSLVSRIPDATLQLHKQLYKQVLDEGMAKIAEGAENAVKEPEIFVETVFELRRSYLVIVKDSLKNEVGFAAELDKALQTCINANQITKNTKDDNQIAMLIADYVNDMLENKNLAEDQVTENLNKAIVLIRYVSNKDIFVEKHQALLAKRLLSDSSVSEDNEKFMISELRVLVGQDDSIRSMEQMNTDMTMSKGKFSWKLYSNCIFNLFNYLFFNLPKKKMKHTVQPERMIKKHQKILIST